jgi:hypothetical protein
MFKVASKVNDMGWTHGMNPGDVKRGELPQPFEPGQVNSLMQQLRFAFQKGRGKICNRM